MFWQNTFKVVCCRIVIWGKGLKTKIWKPSINEIINIEHKLKIFLQKVKLLIMCNFSCWHNVFKSHHLLLERDIYGKFFLWSKWQYLDMTETLSFKTSEKQMEQINNLHYPFPIVQTLFAKNENNTFILFFPRCFLFTTFFNNFTNA